MDNFFRHLLGPTDPAFFAACIVFASAGVFLVLVMGTGLRDKKSPTSPEKFSWAYLWSDNARRIYASAICVLASLRFAPEIFSWELTEFRAFCIGMAWDGISLFVKQKTTILDPKK